MSKKVEVREDDLVNVIANIVEETVEARKVEWLQSEKTKWLAESKIVVTNVLLEKINGLEKQVKLLTNK